ncbi:hypothetical protein SAMN04488134_104123 [Amphibacillus marinus]|uniref:CAAX prenyl protease 2/Lysostaphin resistance protein A-like domain-containing protein n=1 Tax=Amphibacillus marinus TaxID=872970 RepID=A0A1H8ME69_9BACI|nr:type II CAAX endopeptidase family protein [Amphibacillus marinus]SEO15518.1 hypothetical protein SAMN04488134_104123 [Amphibacillus marinus]
MQGNYLRHTDLTHNNELSPLRNELKWKEWLLFVIAYPGFSIVLSFVAAIVLSIISAIIETDLTHYLMMIQYAALLDAVAFGLALLIFRSVRRFISNQFSMEPFKKITTYVYIVATMGLTYISQHIIINLLSLEEEGSQVSLFGIDQMELTAMNISFLVVAFVLLAPITEEILFRGILFGFLNKKLGFLLGLISSSIIFGLLHPGHRLSVTIMALLLTTAYFKTKSLWVTIAIHMIWNAFATYGLLSMVL